jgi:hypothetical protein
MGRLSEELVLSGTYYCMGTEYDPLLSVDSWILATAWEVLALCLAVWTIIKHLRGSQLRLRRSALGSCLTVLMKYHVFYFVG